MKSVENYEVGCEYFFFESLRAANSHEKIDRKKERKRYLN